MRARAIAQALLAAQAERRALPCPFPFAPADEAEAIAAQRELARLMGAERPAGFKIGATAPRMQAYLGVNAPIAGFVREQDIRPSGGAFRFTDYVAPGVECEIGLRLARDIAPGAISPEAAGEAVGEVFAAIELVDNRYADFGAAGAPLLAADRMFQAGGVLGAPVADWRGIDLAAIRGRISIDGVVRDEGLGSALMGHPLKVLAWLAASPLVRAFGGLHAGQVVFLGSVTPPIWLEKPAEVAVEFEKLGLAATKLDSRS